MQDSRKIVTGDLSPLRYPGSKRSLFPLLVQTIQLNKLNPNVLVEPFVGGGNIGDASLITAIEPKPIMEQGNKHRTEQYYEYRITIA